MIRFLIYGYLLVSLLVFLPCHSLRCYTCAPKDSSDKIEDYSCPTPFDSSSQRVSISECSRCITASLKNSNSFETYRFCPLANVTNGPQILKNVKFSNGKELAINKFFNVQIYDNDLGNIVDIEAFEFKIGSTNNSKSDIEKKVPIINSGFRLKFE
ncbi:unnamed protein product, partial [Brachionus calyciflorus]